MASNASDDGCRLGGEGRPKSESSTAPSAKVDAAQPSVPSVATVLQNHLLSKISDDNADLRCANSRMQSVRERLATVKIKPGDGTEIAVDMAKGYTWLSAEDHAKGWEHYVPFHEVPRGELAGKQIVVPFESKRCMPLSKLNEITVCRANQEFDWGNLLMPMIAEME